MTLWNLLWSTGSCCKAVKHWLLLNMSQVYSIFSTFATGACKVVNHTLSLSVISTYGQTALTLRPSIPLDMECGCYKSAEICCFELVGSHQLGLHLYYTTCTIHAMTDPIAMTITKESYREMTMMYMYVHIITSEWHCWASVSEIFSYMHY